MTLDVLASTPRAARPANHPLARHSSTPPLNVILGLQRTAGNAAVAHRLAQQRRAGSGPAGPVVDVQRCGPTPCDCSTEERADYADKHPETDEAADDTAVTTAVQRVPDDATAIGQVAAADTAVPTAADDSSGPQEAQSGGGGTVLDGNGEPAVQRQAADQSGSIVVQRMNRQEEIDLSLTSPGRAVMDPARPSLSLFNFGIDRPDPKAFHVALLAQFSDFLLREVTAPTRIRVVGHADPTGTSPHNQTLSGQRSAAVAAVLQSRGSATETFAEGDSHPVASNTTVDGRSRNRRVDILVSATGPPPRPDDPDRRHRPNDPDRNFCDRYPLLCSISPPGLPIPPWPIICILVPELCLAIPCMINPALCTLPPPPPPPPPDRPDPPDRPNGAPAVVFGPVRALNTPPAMGDRIADQGSTPVPALVTGLDPASGPITVRVANAPGPAGDAQVNGAATTTITGTTLIAVSGLTQTGTSSGGFHLTLEAVHAGSVVGRSAPFAVAAIMFNMHTSTAGVVSDPTGVTLEALMGKASDGAAGIGSLSEMEYGEHLLLVAETGGMVGLGLGDHGFLALADIDQIDNHGTEMRHMLRGGTQTLHQTHSFVDHRTGSREIPVADSGFSIVRNVSPDPARPGCLVFTIVKTGQGATADGIASGAGSGVASARVPLPCPPGPNRPGGATDPATPTIPRPFSGPVPRGNTPIFYQGGVSPTASVGDIVNLTFSFRAGGQRFFTSLPCTVTGTTPTGIALESLNPVPVNVAPLGSPQPIVVPARMPMTVPRALL